MDVEKGNEARQAAPVVLLNPALAQKGQHGRHCGKHGASVAVMEPTWGDAATRDVRMRGST